MVSQGRACRGERGSGLVSPGIGKGPFRAQMFWCGLSSQGSVRFARVQQALVRYGSDRFY